MLKARFTLSDYARARKPLYATIDFFVRKLYNVATKEAYCPFQIYEGKKIFENKIT